MNRRDALRRVAPLALIAALPARRLGAKGAGAGFRVVGYLPDYRMAAFDPDAAQGLTDLVFFSAEPGPAGELRRDRLKPEHLKALRAAKGRHGVALHLCVGGWGRSAGFAPLVAAPKARARFVGELLRFCREEGFDGVDLDWEHPQAPGELAGFVGLLAALKRDLAPRGLGLSIAVAGWQELPAAAFAAVDRVHLMAYDQEGRHSTFDFARADVARLEAKGAPAGSICLGVPLYGRGVRDRRRERTYAEIVRDHDPGPDVDEVDGVSFNGVRTIERKARFARDAGLGGVMIWEVGQDVGGDRSLLRAIRRVADQPAAR